MDMWVTVAIRFMAAYGYDCGCIKILSFGFAGIGCSRGVDYGLVWHSQELLNESAQLGMQLSLVLFRFGSWFGF